MGTRSTTKIYNGNDLILSLYKQYDGYPDGLGKELKDFIKSGKFTNGFGSSDEGVVFNGVGCFALQLVSHLKKGVGGLYATTANDSQAYNYTIKYVHNEKQDGHIGVKGDKLIIECKEDEKFKEVIKL